MKKTRQTKSENKQDREPKSQVGQFDPQSPQQDPPGRRVNFYNDGTWPPGREPHPTR